MKCSENCISNEIALYFAKVTKITTFTVTTFILKVIRTEYIRFSTAHHFTFFKTAKIKLRNGKLFFYK